VNALKRILEHDSIHVRTLSQMVLYGIIGLIGSGFDLAMFSLLTLCMWPILANTLSVGASIVLSYILNSQITFSRFKHARFAALRFFTVGIFGLVLSNVLLVLLMRSLGWPEIWSKVVTIPAIALIQFLLNKFWTFKRARALT